MGTTRFESLSSMRTALVALAATLLVAAAAPAAAEITLLETPDGLVRLDDEVTVSWAESAECRLSYGRVPGTYTDETTAQGWGSLAFTPLNEGMSPGTYYCIAREVAGPEESVEFVLVVDSPVFPTPTSPPNGSVVTGTTTTLGWDAVDGVPYYHVLVSDHDIDVLEENGELTVTGANIVWQAITGETSIQYGSIDPSGFFTDSNGTSPPLMSEFEYHWLVFNNFGNDPVLSSTSGAGLAGFDVDVPVSMNAPDPLSPPDSAMITEEYVDFSWTPVDGASGYHIYVYETREWVQADASFPVWDSASPTASAEVHLGGFLVSGDYRWRVVALDASGRGVASETRSFEYATDTGSAHVMTTKEGGDPVGSVLIETELVEGGVTVLPSLTDEDGILDKPLVPGQYLFRASKADYVDTTAVADVFADQVTYVPISMRKASARMRGVVQDEAGIPVFDADVVATCGSEFLETSTDGGGNFVMQASAGDWLVHAEKPGYSPSASTLVELHADDYVEIESPLTLIGTPGTASGNVVNVAGSAVVGATVSAESSFGSSSSTTNSGGQFVLELAPGQWTLTVEKSGFLPSSPREILIQAGGNTQVTPPVVLSPAESAVMGRVTDGQSDFAGARVTAVPPSGFPVSTETNSHGEFTLLLPVGEYELAASVDGFIPWNWCEVDVSSGESYTGVELRVAPADCSLGGVVLSGGEPVSGALVSSGEAETYTDGVGEFTLALRSGAHSLSATKDGYLSDGPVSVGLAPGQTLAGMSLRLTPGSSSISGVAVHDGHVVAGATVAAVSGSSEVSTESDENGTYRLDLEAGEWDVSADKTGFEPSSVEHVVVATGQSVQGVNPELAKTCATLGGTVSGARDVVRKATVLLYEQGASAPSHRTRTNSDGRYSITVEPDKAYSLATSAPGYGFVQHGVASLEISEDRVLNVSLTSKEAAIGGAATDETGTSLAGAGVTVDGTPLAITGCRGTYEVWVDAGIHELTFTQPGYQTTVVSNVSATSGEYTEVNAELPDVFATLSGTVTDSLTGQPVADVLVTALTQGGASDITSADGTYLLESIVPGQATVLLTRKGYEPSELSIELAQDQVAVLDARLERLSGAISGLVAESGTGATVSGAYVRAKVGDTVAATATSGPDGRYSLEELDGSGFYDIFVSKEGYFAVSENPLADRPAGTTDADFLLTPCDSSITGRVVDAVDGSPLMGATVEADNSVGHFGSAATDEDGYFEIDGLAPLGQYGIVASLYGYHDASVPDVEPGSGSHTLELPRNFAHLLGSLTAVGEAVELSEIQVVATNLVYAAHSQTAEPDELGSYEIEELKPGSYVLSVSGGTYVCEPTQVSVMVSEGESVSGVDFVVEKAVVQRIEVQGPGEVESGAVAHFSGSVFAQEERLVDAELEWRVSPECAGSLDRHAGTVSVADGYIGELAVSALEPESGLTGRAGVSVYVTATPGGAVTASDSLGMTLEIPAGAVSETKSIHLAHRSLPEVRRYVKGYAVGEPSFHLKPSGTDFVGGEAPVLRIPDGGGSDGAVRWSHDLLRWENVESSRAGDSVELLLERLGEYATLVRSGPLGVKDIAAAPNPFSPDAGPVVLSCELASQDARMPFVTVRIYNMVGQLVRELISNEPHGTGRFETEWDGLTDTGETARNGRYVVQVQVEDSEGAESALGRTALV